MAFTDATVEDMRPGDLLVSARFDGRCIGPLGPSPSWEIASVDRAADCPSYARPMHGGVRIHYRDGSFTDVSPHAEVIVWRGAEVIA